MSKFSRSVLRTPLKETGRTGKGEVREEGEIKLMLGCKREGMDWKKTLGWEGN
jgi:hypothetical protein